jgi:hypothetical protein
VSVRTRPSLLPWIFWSRLECGSHYRFFCICHLNFKESPLGWQSLFEECVALDLHCSRFCFVMIWIYPACGMNQFWGYVGVNLSWIIDDLRFSDFSKASPMLQRVSGSALPPSRHRAMEAKRSRALERAFVHHNIESGRIPGSEFGAVLRLCRRPTTAILSLHCRCISRTGPIRFFAWPFGALAISQPHEPIVH